MSHLYSNPTRSPFQPFLEAYLFLLPFALAFGVGLSGVSARAGGLLFAALLVALVVDRIPVALLLYLDADRRGVSNGRRYAVAALLTIPLVVALLYVSRHVSHQRSTVSGNWWMGVALSVVGAVGFFLFNIVSLVAYALGIVVELRLDYFHLLGLPSSVLVGLLPASSFKDAAHLQATERDWRPDPVKRYLLALCTFTPLVVLLPLYVGYYLFRRRDG